MQFDSDQDAIYGKGGDLCDPDDDNDGLLDIWDNCPFTSNLSVSDIDGDSLGDPCDDDADGDGILNDDDPTPFCSQVGCGYLFNVEDALETVSLGHDDSLLRIISSL